MNDEIVADIAVINKASEVIEGVVEATRGKEGAEHLSELLLAIQESQVQSQVRVYSDAWTRLIDTWCSDLEAYSQNLDGAARFLIFADTGALYGLWRLIPRIR